jgi:flagellar biogenesis protein FliO
MRSIVSSIGLALLGLLSIGAETKAQRHDAPRLLPADSIARDTPAGKSISAFPFRQASASEVVAAPSSAPPRKLAPRRGAGQSSLERPGAPTPSTAIGTVVSSLAIVVGLFLAIAWCSRRFAPAGTAPLPKEAIELLGRAPLAGRQTMQLIRVGNRLLLVALSPTGAQTLAEITDPVEVEHLTGLCLRGKSHSASASFSRVLSQLASEGEPARPRARGAA